jgi:hypothetical protein
MAGAGHYLPVGGVLYLYGPFWRSGYPIAPSNIAFDQSLQAQNSAWGIRDLTQVVETAQSQGLVLQSVEEMPANNLSVVLIKST